ncbi:hypothetical protein MEN41_10925 [Dolichospermum sp. ST_con]|nr:hypothetical protein [Dolichospermum sp. ST_con]MDD1419960.1 hypothetical protein [Dolichospermum sp. ST_sed1]MDD1427275.1 hypothetical protein [Dolichospermum sp. ST_sed9]MDD1433102.1 hypothetical protein [Dolichospermum sp. ST_sed6]MDD1435316.1 hypothetical protein [Dolichospermum sp. ST_sed10]MDD1443021.1 hypothetical protein [Dolichospermum sp. ST_sed3]MDD1448119.1 hypothetical protein [Dolichospermum sp. ST_sed8]MDD1453674.1 hypothetical protein [Dolichospermum sp. ST_sed7]MDD146261
MKVTVKDKETLQNIDLENLKNYLQIHGWQENKPFLNHATIWNKSATPEDFEILLPNKESLGDYTQRIQEIIEILATVENRTNLEILTELLQIIPNISTQGIVMDIYTPHFDKLNGRITILGIVFQKLQKIHTELNNQNYILAIKAYQQRLPISFTGDLIKENDHFILQNLHNFQIDNI